MHSGLDRRLFRIPGVSGIGESRAGTDGSSGREAGRPRGARIASSVSNSPVDGIPASCPVSATRGFAHRSVQDIRQERLDGNEFTAGKGDGRLQKPTDRSVAAPQSSFASPSPVLCSCSSSSSIIDSALCTASSSIPMWWPISWKIVSRISSISASRSAEMFSRLR